MKLNSLHDLCSSLLREEIMMRISTKLEDIDIAVERKADLD